MRLHIIRTMRLGCAWRWRQLRTQSVLPDAVPPAVSTGLSVLIFGFGNSSGSFAIFTAILRAEARVSNLAHRPPRLILEIVEIDEVSPVEKFETFRERHMTTPFAPFSSNLRDVGAVLMNTRGTAL